MNDVVAPEIEHAAQARFLEPQARELSIAAVQNRVQKKEHAADDLDRRTHGEEEGRAGEAEADRDERHVIGRNAGTGQPAADGERDRAVEVPRHEPVGVLDESAQQISFGARQVRRRAA